MRETERNRTVQRIIILSFSNTQGACTTLRGEFEFAFCHPEYNKIFEMFHTRI